MIILLELSCGFLKQVWSGLTFAEQVKAVAKLSGALQLLIEAFLGTTV